MIRAFELAVQQLGDPRLRVIVWQSLALSLVLQIALGVLAWWALQSFATFQWSWVNEAIRWLGGGAVAVLALAVAAAARADWTLVEERFYALSLAGNPCGRSSERVERDGVGGVGLEGAAEGIDRALGVRQHVALRVADGVEEELLVLVVERARGLALEHIDVTLPVREQHVEPLKEVQHVDLAVVEREEAVVCVDGRARVVAALVVRLRDGAQEVTAEGDVVGG